jgi:hypothetical protein
MLIYTYMYMYMYMCTIYTCIHAYIYMYTYIRIQFLPLGRETCSACEPGTYSIGGGRKYMRFKP